MRKFALLSGTIAVALVMGAAPSWALTDNVAYVDPENGTDSGNTTCGQSLSGGSTGPCASLNVALQNLPATGGTVVIEKGGVFGPVYLTAGVNIIGPADRSVFIDWQSAALPGCIHGAPGSCNGSAAATYAMDIQAGANNTVKLKNLIINNNGGSAGALHIGSAFGVSLTEITLRGGPASATAPQMMLVDSSQGSQLQIYLHNCDIAFLSAGGGIVLAPTGTTSIKMNVNHSEVHNATFGLSANATGLTGNSGVSVLMDDTQFFSFNNNAIGVAASSNSNQSVVSLTRSAIVNTGGAAFRANGAGAIGVLYETAITGNAIGTNAVNGGVILSYQNNEIIGNGTNCEISGTNTPCSSALTAQSPF
jgi:hypothetical protein